MGKKTVEVAPETQKILEKMGRQIKSARVRRNLSAQEVAERIGVSRMTVSAVEKGKATVSMGTYAAVLHVLDGMDKNFTLIAKEDEISKRMEKFNFRQRATKAPKENSSLE